jgi:hypothetical protein
MNSATIFLAQYGTDIKTYYWQVVIDGKYYKAQFLFSSLRDTGGPTFLIFDETQGYQIINRSTQNKLTQIDLVVLCSTPAPEE